MTEYTSELSEVSILLQAVRNTSTSIELFREAVSNSVDANAQAIAISLQNVSGEIWNVVIQDNGNGMRNDHMRAFFNVGETVKDFEAPGGAIVAIGEKGLGSKTTFVAKQIEVESRRFDDPEPVIVGVMNDPVAALESGSLPTYTIEVDPPGFVSQLTSHGTRITLSQVHIKSFNEMQTSDPDKIAKRLMHYLRSLCATGTVKNRHASKAHVQESVINIGVIPAVTVHVVNALGDCPLGPSPGCFDVPEINLLPTGVPPNVFGVAENSRLFCNVIDFTGDKTLSVGGVTKVVHYDGTAIVAGELIRAKMLEDELRQGWTQKSQMGLHLCKDFIPMRNDTSLSRELLGNEWYYEYKVFLNCQSFELNADRNVITNQESDEVSWIWADFRDRVWPNIEASAEQYKRLKKEEEAASDSVRRTREAEALKAGYASLAPLPTAASIPALLFAKVPRKEADVSHLLAMMVQSGDFDLTPIAAFGQYIDASTDVLAVTASGDPILVELELSLPNLFSHKHPLASYEAVVVWDLGGMVNGSFKTAPWGANGREISVTLTSGIHDSWSLTWGTISKPVIVLKDLLEGVTSSAKRPAPAKPAKRLKGTASSTKRSAPAKPEKRVKGATSSAKRPAPSKPGKRTRTRPSA